MISARRLLPLSAAFLVPLVIPASCGWAADLTSPVSSLDFAQVPASDTLEAAAETPSPDELECMAKVVMHEAGSEPHDGQVAVAQTLVNRVSRHIGGSICEVANQPGQFFKTATYNPDRGGNMWAGAMAVSRAVLTGAEDDVAPGAIFFRAASQRASGFFRTRQRIASVGSQIFYR